MILVGRPVDPGSFGFLWVSSTNQRRLRGWRLAGGREYAVRIRILLKSWATANNKAGWNFQMFFFFLFFFLF